MVEAYQQGGSLAALAQCFEIDPATVIAHINRRGVEHRTGVVKRRIHEARALYESGQSLAQVGQHFGVDAETARRNLRAAGVTLR